MRAETIDPVSAPTRPGAPRSAPRVPRRSADARAPRRQGPSTGSVRRPQTRPGGPSGPGRTTPTPAPGLDPAAPRGSWTAMLTWRTAVILLVVALSIAVVAPSVRAYVDQQAVLADLRDEAAVAQAEVDGLNADVDRWEDRAFIVAQARERLGYVFPGETPYRVVDGEAVDGPADGSPAAEREPAVVAGSPWYDTLWDSVVAAGSEDSAADAGAVAGMGGAGSAELGEGEQRSDVDLGE